MQIRCHSSRAINSINVTDQRIKAVPISPISNDKMSISFGAH